MAVGSKKYWGPNRNPGYRDGDKDHYQESYGMEDWDKMPPDFDRCCMQVGNKRQCNRLRCTGPNEAYCRWHDPERKH